MDTTFSRSVLPSMDVRLATALISTWFRASMKAFERSLSFVTCLAGHNVCDSPMLLVVMIAHFCVVLFFEYTSMFILFCSHDKCCLKPVVSVQKCRAIRYVCFQLDHKHFTLPSGAYESVCNFTTLPALNVRLYNCC